MRDDSLFRVRVKICCIQDKAEIFTAIKMGASALGFVSEMPSGPGVISEDAIRTLAGVVPPGIATVLLTSKQDIGEIIHQQHNCRTGAVQICDYLSVEDYPELRAGMPGIGLIQVIHVRDNKDLEVAIRIAPHVDALLLDSGNPDQRVKELGGTGRTHNWRLSREIVSAVAKPVYLAGGLTPGNVVEAINTVRPFGIDVCGGVRVGGRLDEAHLRDFMDACGY